MKPEPGQMRVWDSTFCFPHCFLVVEQDDESSAWKILCQDEIESWPQSWLETFSVLIDETG